MQLPLSSGMGESPVYQSIHYLQRIQDTATMSTELVIPVDSIVAASQVDTRSTPGSMDERKNYELTVRNVREVKKFGSSELTPLRRKYGR